MDPLTTKGLSWYQDMKFLVILLLAVCEAIGVPSIRNCPKLHLQHGNVLISAKGRIAKFSCDPDYVLDGYNTSVCIGRMWSHALPECVRISNSSITNNGTSLHPDENNSTVNMTTPRTTTTTKTAPINNTTTFLSTTINLQNTSLSTITNLQNTTTTTVSSQRTSAFTTALQTVAMVTNITKEKTVSMVIENTTLVTHLITKATQVQSKGGNYLYIGLTCVAIIAACIVIVIIWYKRRQKASLRSTDKVQLVSRTDSEEHEEWSLLV